VRYAKSHRPVDWFCSTTVIRCHILTTVCVSRLQGAESSALATISASLKYEALATISSSSAYRAIADYAETSGKMRDFAAKVNHKQPGDPVKLAAAIVRLAASAKPPVHFPLGSDTLTNYRAKTATFEKEIAEWHDVITGTDHDDVAK
jgi:hypothetical protein